MSESIDWLVFDLGGVLIDDRQRNVDGARLAGWQGLRFEGVARLRQDLADLGLQGGVAA